MNCINPDLSFTTEVESDFENGRLPTLSFEIWSDKSGIRHSFYEKPMRSQILTMQKSAQSEQSKMSILVNELNRRFDVIDDKVETNERIEVVDHFTTQLVNSGYGFSQAKDIVLSSLKGSKKKAEIRLNSDKKFKSGADTLIERCKKKLLEPTSWYKDKKIDIEEEEENEHTKANLNTWKRYR